MSNNSSSNNAFTYLLKQLIDNPLAFISLVALGGIIYLYLDMREFMMALTLAFLEFTVALKELNLRIQHLELYHLELIRRDNPNHSSTITTKNKTDNNHNE